MSSRGMTNQVIALASAAEGGGYTLPAALLAKLDIYQRTRALEIQPPTRLDPDMAAARIVAAVEAGQGVDLLELGRAVQRSTSEGQAFDQAQAVLREAGEQAGNALTYTTMDLAQTIITEHLRPAFEQVLQKAREAAGILTSLDPHYVVSASEKVRKAYLTVEPLVAQRQAIYDARRMVNNVSGQKPQHDDSGLFATFRKPMTFFPTWQPPARVPQLPIPEDPKEALLWLVRDEQAIAAEPWLPTASEQDGAWWEQFGTDAQNRADAARFSRGFLSH